jgi:hypothetical protein
MPKTLRILDFDLENRPLSYLGSDYTTGDITAIAWAWYDEDNFALYGEDVACYKQTKDDRSRSTMMKAFVKAYDQADIVTGHFIRGYDLPVINGALMELGMPVLSDKRTHDTKLDLIKRKYISASQENLAAMLGIEAPKIQMNTDKWRKANRLTDEGIDLTVERVVGDVLQHMAMRTRMIELGMLGPTRMWKSSGAGGTEYVP